MVEYLKKLAQDIITPTANNTNELYASLYAFSEELDRLDPRDFLPSVQYEFAHNRMRLRRMIARYEWVSKQARAPIDLGVAREICQGLTDYLDHYGGEGSRAVSRDFTIITDKDLRQIIERDYRELELTLLPGGAWKSVVVMAGSILEAILFDTLTTDATTYARAVTSSAAPKDKAGKVRPLDNWTLENLVNVAADIGVIPQARAKAIDQSLRDYRNFVHPKKEIRTGYPCSEAEAYLAKGALDSVLNHLTP